MGHISSIVGGFILGSATSLAVVYWYYYYTEIENRLRDPNYTTSDDGVTTTCKDDNKATSSTSLKTPTHTASPRWPLNTIDRSILEQPTPFFLTDLVKQLWPYINEACSTVLRETVEPMFSVDLPGPLSKSKFKKIDFGTIPIRFDNVIVHELHNDTVQFDLDCIWDGDCNIQLTSPLGPFGIRAIKLNSRLSILFKPCIQQMPIVSAIQYGLLHTPDLALDFTGLADIGDHGIAFKTIREIILKSIETMLVLPVRMLYRMDYTTSFLRIYQHPIGVLRLTVLTGRGFDVEKHTLRKDDIPDVFLNITVGPISSVWKTCTIRNSIAPIWNQSADFVLYDYDQRIGIQAVDEDAGILNSDDFLGAASVNAGTLLISKDRTMEIELQNDGKPTGAFVTIRSDICNLTNELDSFDNVTEENRTCGLLTILISKAYQLPITRASNAASFVKVTFGTLEFVTPTVRDAPPVDGLNPLYDASFVVALTKQLVQEAPEIVLTLQNGPEPENTIGSTSIAMDTLRLWPEKTLSEKCPIGSLGAMLEYSVSLHGLTATVVDSNNLRKANDTKTLSSGLSASPSAASTTSNNDGAQDNAGRLRVTIVSGHGFKARARRLLRKDTPDMYVMVKLGASTWRTGTQRNNTSPKWNESYNFEYSGQNHIIATFEAMDDNEGKREDELLGIVRIAIGKLLLSAEATDVELMMDGQGTGMFITIKCDWV